MEQKRRIDLTTLDNSATKKVKTLPASTSTDCQQLIRDEFVSFQLDGCDNSINDIIQKYMVAFVEKIAASNLKLAKYRNCLEALTSVLQRLQTCNEKFLRQSHFKNLLSVYTDDIKLSKSIEAIVEHNNDLLKELGRLTIEPEKRFSFEQKKVERRVKKLTKTLAEVLKRISDVESGEIDLDGLQNDNGYTKLPLLYKAALKCWKRREMLLNRSVNSGRSLFKKFSYTGTAHQKIDKLVEDYFYEYLNRFNQHEEHIVNASRKRVKPTGEKFAFFSIIDLKEMLKKEIDEQAITDFTLTDDILIKIYRDLSLENKRRRQHEQLDSLRSYLYLPDLEPESMADESDPNFVRQMELNAEQGDMSLVSLVEEFRKKDIELNGEQSEDVQKELGWDNKEDEGTEDSDQEEEEEEEEEDSDGDQAEDEDVDEESVKET